MIFFTADLHLGHENIIRHCNRPFANASIMDEELIGNWNSRVKKGDTVYILGDMFFRVSCAPEMYLERLHGRKHLILGNHDYSWVKRNSAGDIISTPVTAYFESISLMKVVKEKGQFMTLCHYPMMTWQGASHGGLMIFGHIHNNTNATYWPLIRANPQMMNAGVDVNDFQPVTLEELIENNVLFKERATPDRP